MRLYALLLAIMFCNMLVAQPLVVAEEDTLKMATGSIYGTLSRSTTPKIGTVALFISGSGPTDRDGNNPMMKNNSLLMLSDELVHNGIATMRYDKRGIAQSKDPNMKEADLRFDTYVDDAVEWIKWLRKKGYSKIIVVGHSEGSLIGMIAANRAGADAFVSIAGAGFSADKILKVQLREKAPSIADTADKIIDSLVAGKMYENIDKNLASVFRPSVQPYLISWFKYDPAKEIAKLKIPTLILQGTSDIQVSVNNAEELAKAKPDAKLVVIDKMNHVLKETGPTQAENMPAYTNPTMPVVPQLSREIANFIMGLAVK